MRAIHASLLTLFLVIDQWVGQCVDGCLKCDIGNDKCLFCDTIKGYILKTGKCEKVSLKNCLVLSVQGNCAECEPGYYPLNGLCAPAEPKLENCAVMKTATECKYCISGFYLSAKVCKQVENPIDNCQYYEDEGICARCVPQSFLFIDQRYCVPISDPGNCVSWTQITCSKCKPGYFINKNIFFKELFKNLTQYTQTANFLRSVSDQTMRFQTDVCQLGEVSKCAVFDGADRCAVCDKGFSLLDSRCYNVTIPLTLNCDRYDYAGKCVTCLAGFYLADGACMPNSVVMNCQSYNPGAQFSQCLECLSEFFLNDNNCVPRAFSLAIQNCTRTHVGRDTCRECSAGFRLTDDGRACLPLIPNCRQYYPASSTSTAFQCQYCDDFMYLEAKIKTCVNGTVAHCRVFEQFSDECQVCSNGFYRSPLGECLPHLFFGMRTCAQWSPVVPHACETCPANHIRIFNRNSCNPSDKLIANCQVYSTVSTCARCSPGFVPSADGKSCGASTVANCIRENAAHTCEECGSVIDPDFKTTVHLLLSADKLRCEHPDFSPLANCRRLVSGSSSTRCVGCKNLYYPAFLGYKRRRCLASDSYRLKAAAVVANLPDCEVMDLDLSQCLKCKGSKYVSAGACVASCPAGQTIFRQEIFKDFVRNSIYIKRRNYCDAPPIANCLRGETSVNARGLNYGGAVVQGCVECEMGYFPLIAVNSADWGMAHVYTTDATKKSPSNRFAFISECVGIATAHANLISVTASLTNCRYGQKQNSLYGCFSCDFGYTGKVVFANGIYFIEACVVMTTCDATKWFSGFGGLLGQLKSTGLQKFPLELYASCHKCVDASSVVVFEINIGVVRAQTNTGLLAGLSQWNYSADPPYSTTSFLDQTVCMAPLAAWNMPAMCAVVMIVADLPLLGYTAGEPTNASGIFCVACAPGYRAKANPNGYVISCTAIEKCLETEFNGCKKCDKTLAQGWEPKTGTLDLGYCHSTAKSPFCLFGYVNIYDIFVCAICQEGFTLNHDFLCDPVEISDCQSITIFTEFPTGTPSSLAREPFSILINFDPNGCRLCQTGQIVAEGSTEPYCVKDLFQSSYGFTSSSYFAKNCNDSFFDTASGTIRCAECVTGFANINNRCYPVATEAQIVGLGSCVVYDAYTQKCAKCSDFHFLDAGICYDGFLPFCAEYETWEKCRRCQTGYILISTKNSTTVCLAPSPALNCEAFNDTSSLSGELECMNCTKGFYATSDLYEKPAYTCLDVTAVKNCDTHNISFNYRNTALECLRCKPEFYLKFNYCFNRTTIDHCSEFHPTENRCLACETGYDLSSTGLRCETWTLMVMPIANCRQLFDLTSCLGCVANYYLSDNKCLEVPEDERVKFCQYYNSRKGCQRCTPGFFSTNGQCQLAKAKDCLEYESGERCLLCPEGFGFQLNGIIKNCIKIELENCDEFDRSTPEPFRCLVCKQGFYINYETNLCAAVENKIEFCMVYKDATTCERCQTEMAISPDGKYCYASPDILSFVDQNCQESFLSNEPLCNACAPGYNFNNDVCTACKNNMKENGCMYCDPDDNDKCLMCMSGYFMNNAGFCIRVPIPPADSSAHVLKVIGLVISLLVIISS